MNHASLSYSLVLADDYAYTTEGVVAILQAAHDVEVLAVAHDGLSARQLALQHRPDILIIDIGLPRMSGLDVLEILQAHDTPTRSVVLSMYRDDEYIARSFQLGAYGYVLKKDSPDDLVGIVEAALTGRVAVSSSINSSRLTDDAGFDTAFDRLTPRQREVLQLIVDGKTGPEIAETLHISRHTVRTHRQNLKRKLGVSNVAELVRLALESGLLPHLYESTNHIEKETFIYQTLT